MSNRFRVYFFKKTTHFIFKQQVGSHGARGQRVLLPVVEGYRQGEGTVPRRRWRNARDYLENRDSVTATTVKVCLHLVHRYLNNSTVPFERGLRDTLI